MDGTEGQKDKAKDVQKRQGRGKRVSMCMREREGSGCRLDVPYEDMETDREFKDHSPHTEPWRKTCNPGLLGHHRGQCMGPFGRYSSRPGPVEAPGEAHPPKCSSDEREKKTMLWLL